MVMTHIFLDNSILSFRVNSYNQARKVAYIPFPFAHAQITCFFVLVIVAFIPILMLTYLTNEIFGFILNMLTVLCFAGLHEVSRELENPFQNAPNDLPANNFQGQFNEGLMTIFFGYHPDAYWEVKESENSEDAFPAESIDLGALAASLEGGTDLLEQEGERGRDHPLLRGHPLLFGSGNEGNVNGLDHADEGSEDNGEDDEA